MSELRAHGALWSQPDDIALLVSHQIRCTGTAYADFRTKSIAQASHFLNFASMSIEIQCTCMTDANWHFNYIAHASHMLI